MRAGVKVTPEELVPQVYLPERKGSLQVEMLAAARRHGMVSYQLAPRFEDVLREIAAGTPVVVLQNLGFFSQRLALRGRGRLRLRQRHAGAALRDAGARGDAVRRARGGLDAQRLLGDGGGAAGPHPGHRRRKPLAGCDRRARAHRRRAQLARRLPDLPRPLAGERQRRHRPRQRAPHARRARRRRGGAARGRGPRAGFGGGAEQPRADALGPRTRPGSAAVHRARRSRRRTVRRRRAKDARRDRAKARRQGNAGSRDSSSGGSGQSSTAPTRRIRPASATRIVPSASPRRTGPSPATPSASAPGCAAPRAQRLADIERERGR